MTADELAEIITAMMGLEMALAEFYKTCAETWPLEKEFWNKISVQEIGHAEMLGKIRLTLGLNQELFLSKTEINPKSILFTTNEIKNNTGRIKNGKISEEQIFLLARDLEQCVLDSKPYEFIGTIERGSKNILVEIARQTKEHRDSINKKIADKGYTNS